MAPDLSKLHGKWKEKDGLYTLTYDFSKGDQFLDFKVRNGNFSIQKKSLVGSGVVCLEGLSWTKFEMDLELSTSATSFESGVIFGSRDSKNYFALSFDSEWQAINLIEYESEKPFTVEQSVALYSYFQKGVNKIEIKIDEKSTEISINEKLAFRSQEAIPYGVIGFFGSKEIQIGKLKIVGNLD